MACWSRGGSLGDSSNDAMCAPEIAGYVLTEGGYNIMAMGDVGCQYTFRKNYIKPDSMLCWSQGGSLGDFSNDAMCAPEIAGSAGSIQGGGINGDGWCGEMLLDMGCVTTW